MKVTKHIRRDFLSVPWVPPVVGLWGAGGAEVVKKKISNMVMLYQIDGDDKENRMQVKFSS